MSNELEERKETFYWKFFLLKKRQQDQKESLMLGPMSPNEDLIPNLFTVSASPRNGILNQSIRNYLVSMNKVICLLDPLVP